MAIKEIRDEQREEALAMTMVRNITSHSQRAVLVESGEISNRLASEASRAAYLMNILAKNHSNLKETVFRLTRLVENADKFASTYSDTFARLPNRSMENYRNLISLEVLEQALELNENNIKENEDLAQGLRSAIENARVGKGNSEDFISLAKKLDRLANSLADHSKRMILATIGV